MDPSATFEDQLAALLPRLRRFAHALSRNPADADDLTQAAIERALRSKAQWQAGTRLDSWLYRIMRNLWIDTVRVRRRAASALIIASARITRPFTGIPEIGKLSTARCVCAPQNASTGTRTSPIESCSTRCSAMTPP